MSYDYQIVPFSARSQKGMSNSAAAAQQLADLIKKYKTEGYEYYRMDHYNLFQPPGCLAAFFGGGTTVVSYDVAIFRRPERGG